MKEHNEKELVRCNFSMFIGHDTHEVHFVKTLKLFKAWFKLALNWHYPYIPKSQQRQLRVGVVEFIGTGETWIWQNPDLAKPGGWQIVHNPDKPVQTKLF
ncbi:hypothetical protein IJH02_01595 [Candidatus Saccharibacteria bacterium]|nr:hypothetical protein [Candidatus Saccharibacteria bacterium]